MPAIGAASIAFALIATMSAVVLALLFASTRTSCEQTSLRKLLLDAASKRRPA